MNNTQLWEPPSEACRIGSADRLWILRMQWGGGKKHFHMNLLQLLVRMLHSRSMTGGCSYDGAWSLLPPLRGISYFQYALLRSSIPLDKIELNYSVWYLKFGTPPNSGPCVAVTA